MNGWLRAVCLATIGYGFVNAEAATGSVCAATGSVVSAATLGLVAGSGVGSTARLGLADDAQRIA